MFSLMKNFAEHRMQLAKEKMRKNLSYENVIQIPAYRNLTQEEYEVLINNIEAIALLLLETYINKPKI